MTTRFLFMALLIFAVLVILPCPGTDNGSADLIHYLTNSDHQAGQKDMSQFNPPVTPQSLHTLNETTARLYPNTTFCGKDGCMPKSACPFPFVPCGSPLTIMTVYPVNTTRVDPVGPAIAYGLSGWPLQNPIFIIPAGKTDLSLPFSSRPSWIEIPGKGLPNPAIPSPTPRPTPDFSRVTPAPANDENLTARIGIDRDIIAVNETISFRIINQGSHVLIFSCGDPYHIERQEDETWIRMTGVGGTMAFWNLKPGETSKNYSLNTGQPQWVLYENVTTKQPYTFSPGRYRIVLEASISVKRPDDDIPATYTREFVIR